MNPDVPIKTILRVTLGLCALALPVHLLMEARGLAAITVVVIAASSLALWLADRGWGPALGPAFLAGCSVLMAGQATFTGGSASPYLFAFPMLVMIAVFLEGYRTAVVVWLVGVVAGPAADGLGAGGYVTLGPPPGPLLAHVVFGLSGLVFAHYPSSTWKEAVASAQAHERAAVDALAERDLELERRSEAECELQQALAEADQASQAKSQFLASMSHELRTPLNAILGYAELLMEGTEVEEDQADLDRIRASGEHLLSLINDVLDLSKIEAGKMDVHTEPVPVNELLHDVAKAVRPAMAARGNTLRIEAPELGILRGDRRRVRQVLLNLLSNATKFTERGDVLLRATTERVHGKELVVLSVQDTGIGISEEQLGRLFQPFVQADGTSSRRHGGTGLGLVLSRRFARMMGGDVTVQSAPGCGSTFRFTLPRARQRTPLPGAGSYRNVGERRAEPTPAPA